MGLISGAMDANPIMFLPLSYRGRPYTAGLTGSTGPASLTEVAANQLDDNGNITGDNIRAIGNRMRRLYTTSARGPQSVG